MCFVSKGSVLGNSWPSVISLLQCDVVRDLQIGWGTGSICFDGLPNFSFTELWQTLYINWLNWCSRDFTVRRKFLWICLKMGGGLKSVRTAIEWQLISASLRAQCALLHYAPRLVLRLNHSRRTYFTTILERASGEGMCTATTQVLTP